MAKPTYRTISARARVGTATVERVLNGRGGVRPETAEKVILAARELNWTGLLPERHRGILRVEVILMRPEASFFSRLSRAFRRISATLDPAIQLHVTFLDENDPQSIADRIANPAVRRSGLVIASPDHPAVRQALTAAMAQGLPVVQVVSQTLQGARYVGIDNYAAGRVAAMMLARLGAVRGKVAVLCHSHVYTVHRDRVRGFSDYLREHAFDGPDFVHVAFGFDDRDQSSRRIHDLVARWPDLAGLYNVGGANGAVLDTLRRLRPRVFFLGHELNDVTSAALADGTADVILDQLPEAQARRAIDLLLSSLGMIDEPVENPPIRFTTVTAENL